MNGKLAKSFVNLERGRAASSTTAIPFLMTWHSNSRHPGTVLNTLFTTFKIFTTILRARNSDHPILWGGGGDFTGERNTKRAGYAQSYPTVGDGEGVLVPASTGPPGRILIQGRADLDGRLRSGGRS